MVSGVEAQSRGYQVHDISQKKIAGVYPLQKSGGIWENGLLARLSFFLFPIGVPPNTVRLNIFPEGDT
jgi:hypothetical protein